MERKLQEHHALLKHPQTLRGQHTTRRTFHAEIGAHSVLRVADEVLRTDEWWWPKFQTGARSFEQWQRAKFSQPCITFVETRSGVVISFMCARKGVCKDLTKEILRHFEAFGFLNPVILQCDKDMSIIDVSRKVARERNARTVLRFSPKTSHQSNGFVEKQCTDTFRDSHDTTRHKSRRTLAYSFQQFQLPFHLQFVTLDLCSQDSQCDPTAEPHSKLFSELRMYHFCACLVNRYSR